MLTQQIIDDVSSIDDINTRSYLFDYYLRVCPPARPQVDESMSPFADCNLLRNGRLNRIIYLRRE